MGSRKNDNTFSSSFANITPEMEFKEITKDLRNYVISRDNCLCQLCGKVGYHIHHIVYKSLGGKHKASNLVVLCESCHTGNEGVHGVFATNSVRDLLLNRVKVNEQRFRKRINLSCFKRI